MIAGVPPDAACQCLLFDEMLRLLVGQLIVEQIAGCGQLVSEIVEDPVGVGVGVRVAVGIGVGVGVGVAVGVGVGDVGSTVGVGVGVPPAVGVELVHCLWLETNHISPIDASLASLS